MRPAALVLLIVLAGFPAWATEGEPRVEIALREADEQLRALDPKGVPAYGLMLHGGIETRVTFDDNVAATAVPVPDRVLTVAAALSVTSGPHPWHVKASLGADEVRHAENPVLDHRNMAASARVSGESWDRSRAHIELGWARRHELPGFIDGLGAAALPVPVDRMMADTAVLARSGRFLAGGTATVTRLRHQDVEAIGGGMIDQRHRDRWEVSASQRTGFAVTSMLDLFVEARQELRRYDRPTPLLGLDRSSLSSDMLVGAAFDLPERMAGEVVWGRSLRQYASTLFPPHTETIYRGAVKVNATTLTALSGRVWQSVEETGALLQAAVVETGWHIGIEHELLRQLVLTGGGGRTRRRYIGFAADLWEEDVTVQAAAEYRVDHRWFVGLDGRWEDRVSAVRDGGFTRTRMTLRLGARL